jgi:Cysteine-rich CPXCG
VSYNGHRQPVGLAATKVVAQGSRQKSRLLPAETKLMSEKRLQAVFPNREVKRNKATEQDALMRRIANLDASSIDMLYGLEPVYEPGKGAPGLLPEEFVAVQCPYCGERLETRVDLTTDEPSYIEDCQVCCRPIEFTVERADSGALLAVKVHRVG